MSLRHVDPETARRTCRGFRRKTDYYANDAGERPEHEVPPEYPWCERTASPIGPDGGPVLGSTCAPGRGCFVPLIRSPAPRP